MVERLRGRAGVEQRQRRLDVEPLCRMCKAQGRTTIATEIDHIVALTNDGTDDDVNTQPLCRPCHEAKTREDLGQRVKPTIGTDGWPVA